MKRWLKRIGLGVVALVVVLGGSAGVYAKMQASSFDASMDKVYDVPLPTVTRSTDPIVLARGKHLVDSVAACATRDCHGTDLGGGKTLEMGPLGTLSGPNVTQMAALYSDAELARLVKHGIKKDGRSVRFMPVQDFDWLPESDVAAVVSYLRTVPKVDRPNGKIEIGLLGKVLDRRGQIILDVAGRIDHAHVESAPAPTPNAEYGKYVVRLCTGCHGEHLSGGPIPGAPPSVPTPLNLTPHETGLKGWTYADFDKLLTIGVRKNGKQLDPCMPIQAFGQMDDTEKKALWAALESLPPAPFGGR
jgi:mono/diheme cytochrome c family protein